MSAARQLTSSGGRSHKNFTIVDLSVVRDLARIIHAPTPTRSASEGVREVRRRWRFGFAATVRRLGAFLHLFFTTRSFERHSAD
jgi:hypothetical protein